MVECKPKFAMAAAIALGFLLSCAGGRALAATINGVYALGQLNKPIPQAVLNNPNVDGVALEFLWNDLEPGDGEYKWAVLDQQVRAAASHGKKVSLTITPGIFSPDWLYSAGAQRFTFRWDKPWGFPPCSEQGFPVPWDSVYVQKWQGFIRALGARYNPNPAVVLVKITGVNGQTSELLLPHSSPNQARGGGARLVNCTASDDNSEWQRFSYRPEKVKQAWLTFADTFAQAFPDKKLSVELVPGGLPPITDSGDLSVRSPGDVRTVMELVSAAIKRYPNQFVVQNDGLSGFWDWKGSEGLSRQVPVGYQMLWRASNDPQCRMNHFQTPCNAQELLSAAINRGIGQGASFLEIYIPDILNPEMQGVLAEAHTRLNSQPAPTHEM